MEKVVGMDVDWMTHGAPKDRPRKPIAAPLKTTTSTTIATSPTEIVASPTEQSPTSYFDSHAPLPTDSPCDPITVNGTFSTRTLLGRSATGAATTTSNGAAATPSPQRRNSWISSTFSKLSGGSAQSSSDPQSPRQTSSPNKNGILQPGTKVEGDAPYTPAPPKTGQAGLLGVLRRFSSAGGLSSSAKSNHGLVGRRTLNIDHKRERCPITDLNQAKLRKVAFCVDVEIAPQPRYSDATDSSLLQSQQPQQQQQQPPKTAATPPAATSTAGGGSADNNNIVKNPPQIVSIDETETNASALDADDNKSASTTTTTKKKEKKKKSEEERKARKEKKRRLAEANGSIPMEIYCDDSDDPSPPNTPNTTHSTATTCSRSATFPTTNPLRIYRRCCQLRETPILKKVTEQLSDQTNYSTETGMIYKLNFTGYWLQLEDLRTLGDYLAVVPVRELVLEGCGMIDEGLRYVLAGLLAVKRTDAKRKRLSYTKSNTSQHGGVLEHLVLKNNDFGVDGWKHICLFIYLCKSLKCLDLSDIPFPSVYALTTTMMPLTPVASASTVKSPASANFTNPPNTLSMAQLFARSVGERLAGSHLELLNLGGTLPTSEQLGVIIGGVIQCGLKRLGLANNHLDIEGVEHVGKYLSSGRVEGLDLSGNDLGESLGVIASSMTPEASPWALSLADCSLTPPALAQLLPMLAKLDDFRFLDLSHNHDLFNAEPNAVAMLRKYLPKMEKLKRIHLANVSMTYEQAIAIIEILPDITKLAHIRLLGNPSLAKLAAAITSEEQEEACALYASLLTATRLSQSIVNVEVEVPNENSSELVKAMAKQVVAYCLRNMESFPVTDIGLTMAAALSTDGGSSQTAYPNIMTDLVDQCEVDDLHEPDENYVLGGTGVVKALACCLLNNNVDLRRTPSGQFKEGGGTPTALTNSNVMHSPKSASSVKFLPTRAREMSKQLLTSARKIRARLQPALVKAREDNHLDDHYRRRLLFLDQTLQGIIKRFEDEFPETRLSPVSPMLGGSLLTVPGTPQPSAALTTDDDHHSATTAGNSTTGTCNGSDEDDASMVPIRPLSRTGSSLSQSSRALGEEEGRILRAGHRLRAGIIKPEHYDVLASGVDEIGADPKHARMLDEMLDDLGPEVKARKAEKGVLRTFKEDHDLVMRSLCEADPEHWALFAQSQEMARVNVGLGKVAQGATEV